MSIARRDFLKLTATGGAMAGILAKGGYAPAATGKFPSKVVILGFDGASPHYVQQWMDAGLLPNLATLRSQGTFSPIMTANPPQTPVSWASFATGMNPGKTKLFDFLRRNPETYLPELALVKEEMEVLGKGDMNPLYAGAGAFAAGGLAGLAVKMLYGVIKRRENPLALRKMFDPKLLAAVAGVGVAAGAGAFAFTQKYLPDLMPKVDNGVAGQSFWQYLDEKDIATLSFRVPARFPADRLKNGRAVAGLGLPDIHKTMGVYTYYTTELLSAEDSGDTEMGGKVVPLFFKPTTNETKTVVFGPQDEIFLSDKAKELRDQGKPYSRELKDLSIPLKIKDTGDGLELETPDWSGKLKVGQWSEPVTFSFKFNRFVSIEGYAKFYLLETSPDVKLYLQPISFHPKTNVVRYGPVRASTPQSFIGDLYDKYGKFKTLGWAAETMGLDEGRIPEEVFLEDMYEYVGQYRQMMMDFVRSDEPLFVDVYSFTDRVAHMFWHHTDPSHPMYDKDNAEKYSGEILKAYQTMDAIVGDVMKALKSDARLFILSDHGFHSWKYAFNYNTWLAKNGFLVSKRGAVSGKKTLDDLFGKNNQLWQHIDWTKSTAYAMGLGGIYINVAGREGKGIVTPAQYPVICAQIQKGLESYVDPNTGEKPVFKVYHRDDIYTSYDAGEMPDLRAANNPGYRASWQSSLGGTPPDIIDTNKRKWSGDHCSFEPSLTRGIFFSNQAIAGKNPHLMDFFPTVLDIFGYKAPGNVDGKSLV